MDFIEGIISLTIALVFFYSIYNLVIQVIYSKIIKMILFDIQNGKIPDFNQKIIDIENKQNEILELLKNREKDKS